MNACGYRKGTMTIEGFRKFFVGGVEAKNERKNSTGIDGERWNNIAPCWTRHKFPAFR